MNSWKLDLFWTAFPLALLLPGSLLAVERAKIRALSRLTLRFSTGAIFSVITVGLIPGLVGEHDLFLVIVGFAAGIMLMLLIEQGAAHHDDLRRSDSPRLNAARSAIGITGIGLAIAGVALSLTWLNGRKTAVLLALALGFRFLWVGITHKARMASTITGRRIAGRTFVVLALCFNWGAGIGAFVLRQAPVKMVEFLLAAFVAATLFQVMADMMEEPQDERPQPFYTAAFFVGFLVFLIIRINI
ncbi:hypothetical protein [Mucilaginibacter defluvii]|uniref:Membrane protein n=1 Tax=Mucilaginibacter defluvii TaxID=1196019 RepID=A0ABP9FXI8_9SPHI